MLARLTIVVSCVLLSGPHALAASPRSQASAPPAAAPAEGTYWCTMHPNVRGNQGDVCRICHMALVPAPAPDYAPYRLDLGVTPRAPKAGATAQFRLTVRDPRTNAVVRNFELVHERILHFFIISQDLEHFAHVHPQLQSDGTFLQSTILPRAGAYRLIADFLPAGGVPQMIQQSVVTAGFTGSLVPNAALVEDLTDKLLDGVRVKLSMPRPVAGREQLLTFQVEDAATGRPVADLEPYLGATGHVLLVSSDLQTAAHSHPVADLSATVGPVIVFQALFPREGAYRVWVQFQRRGRVLVAPFTVVAAPRTRLSGE